MQSVFYLCTFPVNDNDNGIEDIKVDVLTDDEEEDDTIILVEVWRQTLEDSDNPTVEVASWWTLFDIAWGKESAVNCIYRMCSYNILFKLLL